MTKVHVPLSSEEYNLLHQISSSELRLPEQMLRWLLYQEAARRGLSNQISPNKNKIASVKVCETTTGDFVTVNP